MSKKFPKQMFVVRREGAEPGDEWLDAERSSESFDDGAEVAVYELVAIKKKVVTHALEDK